jgi:polyisoprenyl-phosphate glycosyltransferase
MTSVILLLSCRSLPTVSALYRDGNSRPKSYNAHLKAVRITGSLDELFVLIPIYNDWTAAGLLLPRLDHVLADAGLTADVLLVDDGSTAGVPPHWPGDDWRALGGIEVLSLRRNIGHQRAIAIALAFVDRHRSPDVVVVMDGDGEDAPEDIPRLLASLHQHEWSSVVFAERTRRSESAMFRVFYALYRWAHRLLTGIPVRVGNFSVIPFRLLRRLVVVSELWNHYAAAVFKARLPRASIPTQRAPRLAGKSRMNFVDLVMHGLSALSVHAELVGVRLLVVTAIVVSTMALALLAILAIRLFTPLTLPAWTSIAVGVSLIVLLQVLAFASLFAFLVLHARSQPTFIPVRDYEYFVDRCVTLVASAREPRASSLPHGSPG